MERQIVLKNEYGSHPGVGIMNIIKALIVTISFISFTPLSHAVAVDPSASDLLYVTVDGPVVSTSPGRFDSTGETFFNVVFDTVGQATAVGSSFDINFKTLTADLLPVTAYLYKDDTTDVAGTGTFDATLDLLVATASGINASFSTLIDGSQAYFLKLVGIADANYEVNIQAVSAVPVPAAGILFATVLFGVGTLGRRKKKTNKNEIVGAFARSV